MLEVHLRLSRNCNTIPDEIVMQVQARQVAFKKTSISLQSSFPVLRLRPPRRLAGLEAVVAVLHPRDPDGTRQPVPGDLLPAAEGVALALHDQRRRLDLLQVLDPELIWLPNGVEGIAQADVTVHGPAGTGVQT